MSGDLETIGRPRDPDLTSNLDSDLNTVTDSVPAASIGAPVGGPTPPGGRRAVILRGGLWTAASQLVPSVGVALLSVVAARLLGPDTLGRQSLIAYVNSALAAVVVTGLGSASLRMQGVLQGSGRTAELDRLGAWTVRAHVLAGSVLFVVLVGIGLAVGQDRLAWTVIGLVTVVDAAVSGIGVRVAVRDGWAEVGRLQLFGQLVGPPLGVAAVVAGLGIPGIFGADGLAAAALLVVMVRRFLPTFPSAGRVGWRPPVPFAGTWLLFSLGDLVTQVVARRIEFVVLALVSTDRQIATYSIAFMLVSLTAQVPSSIAVAALPVVASATARGEDERASHHLRLAVRVGTLLSIPLAGLVAALGPPAITVVYGSRYADAARLVPLAGVVLLFAVAGGVCGQFWSGRGRLVAVLVLGGLAGAVDLGAAFALAPALGATGAVIANIAGQAVAAAGILAYTVRRLGGIGWSLRSLSGMAVATVAGADAAVLGVRLVARSAGGLEHLVAALLELAVGAVAGIVVFGGTARLVRVLAADEAEWIAPLLPAPLQRVLLAVTVRSSA